MTPNNILPASSEFPLYETEDGRARIECRFADDAILHVGTKGRRE
jgi:hypothetical protein